MRSKPPPRLRDLRAHLRRGALRLQLQTALRIRSVDAEDLLAAQIQYAGRRRRPLYALRLLAYRGGGTQILRDDRSISTARRRLLADYTLADALPVHLDFPLPGDAEHAERFIALVLIGPRVGIVQTPRGGAA